MRPPVTSTISSLRSPIIVSQTLTFRSNVRLVVCQPDARTRDLTPGAVLTAGLARPRDSDGVVSRAPHPLALASLAVGNFVLPFQNLMVIPSIPTIERDLHASTVWGTWLLTGFLLVSSITSPILGRLGDQFGKRRILNWALGVFLLGALGATIAPSMGVLVVCRCIQGAGGAVVPLGFALIKDEFPAAQVPRSIGLLSAMTPLGSGAALALSGSITDAFGWRVLFAVAAVLVAIAWVGALLFVPESSRRVRAPIDVRGAVLLSLGLVALLVTITEADSWGWGSARVICGFAFATVLLATWLWAERWARAPMVDLAMLARRPVWLTNLGALLGTGFGMTSALLLLPQFLSAPSGASPRVAAQAGYGFGADSSEVGLIMLSWALGGVLGAAIATRLARRRDGRWPLTLGGIMMAIGLGGIAAIHASPWQVVGWLLITGCGFGQAAMGAVTVVVSSVRPSETGAATGMSTVIRQIGGTAGAELVAAILAANLIAGSAIPTESAFMVTFGLCAAGAALSAVCGAFVVPRRRNRGGSARHVTNALALDQPPLAVLAPD
jgi:MFS family permease